MGIALFSRCSSTPACSEPIRVEKVVERIIEKAASKSLPNPDPRNFVIEKIIKIGKFVIVKVNYPNCTNFEGDKILVFRGVTKKKILSAKRLDPHFCKNSKHPSPVARFEPTSRGWHYAMVFCKSIKL